MAQKGKGLEALSQAQRARRKKKEASGERSDSQWPSIDRGESAVHPGHENPEFTPASFSQGSGAARIIPRVTENPTIYHPVEPVTEKKARPKKARPKKSRALKSAAPAKAMRDNAAVTLDSEEQALRAKVAVSTEVKPVTLKDAQKLMAQCRHLLAEFEEVARQFQRAGSGRREGPVYEAWRDVNHAQVLVYRAMSMLREGFDLKPDGKP